MQTTLATLPFLRVADIVERYPDAAGVFARHGVDLCCGGGKTLEFVVVAHRLDLDSLLRELTPAVAAGPGVPPSR